MKVLILGTTGATGSLVVQQLLEKNIFVRAVIRESAIIPEQVSGDKNIEIIRASIYDFDISQIKELVKGCESVICCLGHNINLKGIVGPPHKLVYNTVRKITEAIQSQNLNTKFILMSTTAYTNKKIGEVNSFGEKLIFSLLYVLLPPHKDNMLAANHLVYKVSSNTKIDWVAVRPDSLFDEKSVSEYEIHNNKIRSAVFNAGKTSRINVAHFIAELLTDEALWNKWKLKMPVIYNTGN